MRRSTPESIEKGRGKAHDLNHFDEYHKARGFRWPVVNGKETLWRFREGYDPYVKAGEGVKFYGYPDGKADRQFRCRNGQQIGHIGEPDAMLGTGIDIVVVITLQGTADDFQTGTGRQKLLVDAVGRRPCHAGATRSTVARPTGQEGRGARLRDAGSRRQQPFPGRKPPAPPTRTVRHRATQGH